MKKRPQPNQKSQSKTSVGWWIMKGLAIVVGLFLAPFAIGLVLMTIFYVLSLIDLWIKMWLER